MFCQHCGAEVNENAVVCVKCGCAISNNRRDYPSPDKSPKDWTTTILLCFFLGGWGVHSFYAGKTGIGVIQLLTLGGCGIWVLIDLIMIAMGNYTDANGKKITNN